MKPTEWTLSVERKWLKKILRPPARLTLEALSWLEGKLWANVQLRYSPVFIVAPPRAGTTLLYQLMTGCLATSYFTNLAMRFNIRGGKTAPIFGAYLSKLLGVTQNHNTTFKSYYGATKGWGGAHEGRLFWNQWFPQHVHAIPPGYLSSEAQRGVYRAVAGTERAFDLPFVNKRIMNSVRIEALAEIFPQAILIRCTRNPLDIAQSIFVARTRDFPFQDQERDPKKFWVSVRPNEYETIKYKDLIEQVCEQVYYVEQSIIAAREALGEDRFLTVDYKDLCQSPHREIERIIKFMNDHNAPTDIVRTLPDSFPYSTGCKIDEHSYIAMRDYVNQLYGYSGADEPDCYRL